MIKNSIVFLILLCASVLPKTNTSVEITGTWVLKSVNGKVDSNLEKSYVEFKKDGWFIWGDLIDGILEESRWAIDRDSKAVFLYSETKRNNKSNPPEIIKIEEFTEGILILRFDNEDVMAFENLNITKPEAQELFKLRESDTDEILQDTIERGETKYVKEDLEEVEKRLEAVDQENINNSKEEESPIHKKEDFYEPGKVDIEELVKTLSESKAKREPRMDILVEDSALIGRWNIVAINMGYGVMGKITTGMTEGFLDFKKDGSIKMNVKGQKSVEGLKWVLDQNNNTVIFYDLVSETDEKDKAEFHKIFELYKNKMTLQIEPIKWYFYLEKNIKK